MIVYDVQDLVKIYPGQAEPANKGITLQIHAGEILCCWERMARARRPWYARWRT